MSRLPKIDKDALTEEQRRVHDAIVSGPRGRLAGPMEAWLNSPGLADPAQRVGAHIRYSSSLPQRLTELAIIITGRHWRAQYEWYAHAPLAIKEGVPEAAVEAIRIGQEPSFAAADEGLIYRFVTELLNTKRVSQPLYDEALGAFGLQGVVDLVGTVGYYGLVSVTLNTFQVPLPEGADLPFPE